MTALAAQQPPPTPPITLYRFARSGHCHRVQLMLSLLALPHRLVDVNLAAREHKQPAFLALNPVGKVPVIDDGGTVLADSNAILVYLASVYDDGLWLPREPVAAARVQRWLSVAAGELAFGPAAARMVKAFGAPLNYEEACLRAATLFDTMEQHLAHHDWLAAPHPTLADIANYSYTALAHEGGLSLQQHPALRAWLARLEQLPRFLPVGQVTGGVTP